MKTEFTSIAHQIFDVSFQFFQTQQWEYVENLLDHKDTRVMKLNCKKPYFSNNSPFLVVTLLGDARLRLVELPIVDNAPGESYIKR